ncbi:protein RICE SALT SENSITIVE 3-like [Phragmites australis]|uniref:protein RICE SALT SENSITIVE 3-like n=1 Tax=Phragmites australis TaxID=29695 RepID=UPI002D774200|nr:protein RICE SALT SENSITIVE 3-like [Phragmites australis]
MEEHLSPVAVTHLLQHTLRSLCAGDAAAPQWVYAVFWRILPRNYPPPKWDLPGAAYDRARGNRRNWILAWEDGFCNFAATTSAACGQEGTAAAAAAYAGDCEAAAVQEVVKEQQQQPGLQPELFFKMSHDIYNYGEGLIGKVAADHSHKWVFKEPQEHEINIISSWSNPADSHPRTWEAQFQSGIQTIALIAVREGVVQLGSIKKVAEDLSYVVMLRRKFGYLESIPGVLLPHPSSSGAFPNVPPPDIAAWPGLMPPPAAPPLELYDPYGAVAGYPAAAAAAAVSIHTMPSMSSLEALLSKLPSVVPAPPPPPSAAAPGVATAAAVAKEEVDDYVQCHGMDNMGSNGAAGESTSTSTATATAPMSSYFVNVGGKPSERF